MMVIARVARRKMKCPRCDSEDLHEIEEPATVSHDSGRELGYTDRFTRCLSCGNEFYTKAQSLAHSRALAGAKRQADGYYSPDEIKAIRAKLGLTQSELEQALRTGPKTVVRWERGTVTQGRAADSLLWIAHHYPGVFAKLAERNGVRLQRDTPSLAVASVTEPLEANTGAVQVQIDLPASYSDGTANLRVPIPSYPMHEAVV